MHRTPIRFYNDFIGRSAIRSRPSWTANLFDTTGLAAFGGAAQGAQNLAYDPNAAAGIIDPNATIRTR